MVSRKLDWQIVSEFSFNRLMGKNERVSDRCSVLVRKNWIDRLY